MPSDFWKRAISLTQELNLKKAALPVGVKKINMIPSKDLLRVTGYIKGGCSPVGMKISFPSFLDQRAEEWETIVVSAGKVGWQVELSPRELTDFIGASYQDLI